MIMMMTTVYETYPTASNTISAAGYLRVVYHVAVAYVLRVQCCDTGFWMRPEYRRLRRLGYVVMEMNIEQNDDVYPKQHDTSAIPAFTRGTHKRPPNSEHSQ